MAAFGDVFANIGVREPLPNASQAFTKFGDAHRSMDKFAIDSLRKLKPVSLCCKIILFSVCGLYKPITI